MRGVSVLLAAGTLSLALNVNARADAGALASVEKLAADKAAAVELVKARAERHVALAAGDRLFTAYLNTASLGEAARLQPRIATLLKTLVDRYGIRDVIVSDRAGTFLARAGNYDRLQGNLDPKTDPRLKAGFAVAPHQAQTIATDRALNVVAPVLYREQNEFVVSARQDLSSYRQALALGLDADRFVVLTDAKGVILADSRPGTAGSTIIVEKLTRDAIAKLAPKGSGEIAVRDNRYRVSHRAAGSWTIIAVERVAAPRRCQAEGTRLCG